MITRYDGENAQIEYLRVTPGSRVGNVQIRCEAGPDDTTKAHVTYTFTALSEHGNAYVETFTEAHFRHHMMAWWQKAINHYLATGETLKAHHR